ncbi:hypothetical protein ETD83_29940 [Actinomadura soli]|uniref:Uncharacterized protein n=1 Tax=Actinomadura soli TaxID=2508997 RepID=A0A5C4J4B1_9ACTN|nr:hypothetical protein [Actinomadura soli]TMQ91632.1 hypothetical protein ETD83_29940 [Actinomadura soli]
MTPDHRELAERGARARGVPLARYVELLIEGDEIARNFEPPGRGRRRQAFGVTRKVEQEDRA